MNEEAESESEGIEQCTVTRSYFSMSPQMINQAVGELHPSYYISSYISKSFHTALLTVRTDVGSTAETLKVIKYPKLTK